MEILDAHERLARLTADEREELLPVDCQIQDDGQSVDAWPAMATAGLIVINWLPQLETDQDLREGLRHVAFVAGEGLIDPEEWQAETRRVVDTLLAWGWEREKSAAGMN